MSRSTFNILFYVNKAKEKDGIVPAMRHRTVNGTQSQFFASESAKPSGCATSASGEGGK